MKKLTVLLLLLCLLAGCAAPAQAPAAPEPEIPTAAPSTEDSVPPPPTEAAAPPTTLPTEPPEPEDWELVRVLDHIPTARQDLAYATEGNFTGQRVYDFTDAYLRYGTVKRLIPVCEELAEENLGILIWDGFRPLEAQWDLWNMYPDPAFVSHPETGSRSHCRGSAIDLTLVDLETGEMLEMPTDFDDFSPLADRDYADCGPAAAANAALLQTAMERQGFNAYFGEWWHFSDPEEYPVEEEFQPPQTIFTGGVG